MATADSACPVEQDWAVSNPWPWMTFALTSTAAAFAAARLRGDELSGILFPCLLAGVFAAVVALWLRFRQPGRAAADRFAPAGRTRVLAAGEVVCAALVIAATFALVTGVGRLGGPWSPFASVLLWLAVAPWAAYLGFRFWRALAGGEPLAERHDGAALALMAATVAFLACWALYFGPDQALEWDSMRLFFAGMAAAALLASYIAGAAGRWRYRLVSAVILAHFGGILSICLAHQPATWSALQIYIRLYRPYLDFMGLTSPYRYYAPEPGPAPQLWFFVEYADPKTNKPAEPVWVKVPNLDEDGNPQYPFSIQYHRRVAMMENAARTAPAKSLYVVREGRQEMADHYRKRDDHSLFPQGRDQLGRPQPGNPMGIPYHPTVLVENQYGPPETNSRILIQAFARRVCRQPHPTDPNLRAVSAKIYRARHLTLRPEELAAGADPHDHTLYMPYYMGKYGPDGTLLDPDDPLLNWLVPILRSDPADMRSVHNYVIQHATTGRRQAPRSDGKREGGLP